MLRNINARGRHACLHITSLPFKVIDSPPYLFTYDVTSSCKRGNITLWDCVVLHWHYGNTVNPHKMLPAICIIMLLSVTLIQYTFYRGTQHRAFSGQSDVPADLLSHHEWEHKGSKKIIHRYHILVIQGGSNMTGTNCDLFTHSRGHIWTTLY
jgi:hypothetical protein